MKSKALWCAGMIACSAGAAFAQSDAANFPNKPVRLVVGYTPGGGTDLTARYIATALSDLWNATVLVDNRPGAGGVAGDDITAKSAPDGYTLLFCVMGTHAITPARGKAPFEHPKAFTYISLVGATPNVLMTHPAQPFKNVGDIVAYAKANPGKLSYGSSGVGASPHMSVELLKAMTGADIVHVPYKGAAPALTEVIGGQIPLSVGNLPGGPLAAIRSGRLRGVGVTTAKRSTRAPEVPTFAEGGVAGYDVAVWYGICGPQGMPKPLVAKINSGLVKILGAPALQERMAEQAVDSGTSTPEFFLDFVKKDIARWVKVVKAANIPPE